MTLYQIVKEQRRYGDCFLSVTFENLDTDGAVAETSQDRVLVFKVKDVIQIQFQSTRPNRVFCPMVPLENRRGKLVGKKPSENDVCNLPWLLRDAQLSCIITHTNVTLSSSSGSTIPMKLTQQLDRDDLCSDLLDVLPRSRPDTMYT